MIGTPLEDFLRTRSWLKANQAALVAPAVEFHAAQHPELLDEGYLSPADWRHDHPIPLEQVTFSLRDAEPVPDHRYSAFRPLLPIGPDDRYHEAVDRHDKPQYWFNGASYRLLAVDGLSIEVGTAGYWDNFDFSQALAHEAADAFVSTGGISGAFRQDLGDPLDFPGRVCAIGFQILTVRKAPEGCTFLVHRRGEAVAAWANIATLVPAGEFQPSEDSPGAIEDDLDLWRCMMREYAEELLGFPEVARPDYDRDEPFRALQEARRESSIRPYFLKIGLDPLTWKALIQIVCVFDHQVFDRIFAGMVSANEEGLLEPPARLDEETVRRYLADPQFSAGATSTLALAWRFRAALGIEQS
ncbi:hypothetical protein D5S17_35215 [Pseudonocardiaceae bacterium YIM PH 21723]|nr:hypothetical protein D5S17_35215 [Pseudonocardiaceae bacterium YIM PH 21723]